MNKIIIFLVMAASINSFSQFSSGTDYSVKKSVEKNEISASFIFEKNDTEWKVGYENGSSFAARSEAFGYGYGLSGKNYFNDVSVSYGLNHMIRDLSASVSIDSSFGSGQTTNISMPNLSLQDMEFETGLYYKNAYGIFSRIRYISSDESDKSSFSGGIRAEYKYNFNTGASLTAFCGFASEGDKDVTEYAALVTTPEPVVSFGAEIRYPFGKSEFCGKLSYSTLNKETAGAKDKNYINAEIDYKISIERARSVLSAQIGVNLSEEMKSPEIHLPFFYNGLELSNSIIADRLDLSVGWKYEMFKSLLSDRIGSGFIPAEITSPEDIDETSGYNRIEIKVTYLY